MNLSTQVGRDKAFLNRKAEWKSQSVSPSHSVYAAIARSNRCQQAPMTEQKCKQRKKIPSGTSGKTNTKSRSASDIGSVQNVKGVGRLPDEHSLAWPVFLFPNLFEARHSLFFSTLDLGTLVNWTRELDPGPRNPAGLSCPVPAPNHRLTLPLPDRSTLLCPALSTSSSVPFFILHFKIENKSSPLEHWRAN